ncbi:CAP domain-containing protein [Singulisphaera sp. PoT]|uniref:CAP domain-containing protein n=1 Tax=Singulisphaera sp. PoT TaxID=3411797 RepID=UPI003BF617E6
MSRPTCHRTLRLELLESRELLSSGGPTDQQQYMLYLLNQARTNPAAMANRVTSNLDADVSATVDYYNVNLSSVKNAIASTPAKPPLAWNTQLANAAQGQSQYQADSGVQSHTGANGSSLEQRLDQAGYKNRTTDGENAYAYSDSVDQAMQAFLIDWGVSDNGHRNNILQPVTSADNAYREVGIGIVKTNKNGLGPYVITQDFGAQQGDKAQLLGVAFNDNNSDDFFQAGEGQGNVTIQATNTATGQTTTVQTWDSGGYQMALDPGTYKVTALVGNSVVNSQNVTIGTQNVEVDYNLSDKWQGGSVPAVTPTVTKASTPPPTAPTTTSTPAAMMLSNVVTNSQKSTTTAPVTTSAPVLTATQATGKNSFTSGNWASGWSSWVAQKKS